MVLDSVSTIIRKSYVAGFAAVRTIPEAVRAEPHLILSFADRAVLFADALLFHFVALVANDRTGHGSLQQNCT
jgi:hypothetical protein